MRIALSGATRPLRSDAIQRCAPEGRETVCEISPQAAAGSGLHAGGTDPRYLASMFTVPARNPAIVTAARKIVGAAGGARDQGPLMLAWIGANVRRSPVDVFSELDVLAKREAECQGHLYLYAAFARSLGIPTRRRRPISAGLTVCFAGRRPVGPSFLA